MHLYTGTSKQFVLDTVQNQIGAKLESAFFDYYRFKPSQGEVNSWQNSLSRLCNVIQYAGLDDNGVILEYQLPLSSKRLDVMFTGIDADSKPNGVIVELKQWSDVAPSDTPDCVVTYVGKGLREVLHPSRQVGNYQQYLQDSHTAFGDGGVGLASCAFLHNLTDQTGEIFDARHSQLLQKHPVFVGNQSEELAEFLGKSVGKGNGAEVLSTVLESRYKAGKKLLDHTAAMIKEQNVFVLLDGQQVVFNNVVAKTRKAFHDKQKVVLLVNGGPGTGKSIIALNLVGELSRQGYNAQHVTGSKAFTENMKKIVGTRAAQQFRYFNGYMSAAKNDVDILILDEAHRLRPVSHNQYTPAAQRTDTPQIEELISAAKVCVFFIDDLQMVRPTEVGSSQLIRDTAQKMGARLFEFELETQFRCSGSDAYINWIDNTLGIRRTANVLWDRNEQYQFGIVDSAKELEAKIRGLNNQSDNGKIQSARLSAGFCWPWSKPLADGSLIPDVSFVDSDGLTWAMPWNAKDDATRLARGIPKSNFWASDPNGIDQVGCVYTAQGFEFDYAGIIFGKDLRYDPKTGKWVGDKTKSQDAVVKRAKPEVFVDLVKSTYRVLLTRGIKGTFVYFEDEATRDFVRSRME